MSSLADDLLDSLSHSDYDPVKAREYYLRTRELKGRQAGAVDPTGTRRLGSGSNSSPSSGGKSVSTLRPKKKVSPALQRRIETKARIEAINLRLEALRKVLAELVEAAKARSGVEAKPTKPTKAKAPVKKAKPAGSEKLTAAQKKEAAKKAKERYEKEKGKNISLTDQEKVAKAKLDAVQDKIKKARKDLQASIERAKKKKTSKNPAAR